MFKRFSGIVKKEFIELLRDKLALILIFIAPVLVIFLEGYGLVFDVKKIPLAFLDYDRSKLSREYINSFVNSEYFKFYRLVSDYKEAEELIKKGEIRALIVIPSDFSRKLYKWQNVQVQILVDGTYPNRAQIVKGYVSSINFKFNMKLLQIYAKTLEEKEKFPIEVEMRAWYNPALESKNFIMPGELVTILCFYPILISCLAIVREKELGSIFNFYCSPAKSWEIVLGKAIPYIVVSFLTYLTLFFVTVFVFKAKFIGNFIALSIGSFLYISCTVGFGFLISSFTKTQITAMLLAFVLAVLPSYLYSGYLCPISSMDISGQIMSKFIPATYFLKIVRGIYLKGLGLNFYIDNLFYLCLYGFVVYALTILRFKKRIG